jgi:hypothetical protein
MDDTERIDGTGGGRLAPSLKGARAKNVHMVRYSRGNFRGPRVITNIPTPQDFFQESRNCLNLAWHMTMELLECDYWDEDWGVDTCDDEDVSDDILRKAQYVLRNALTLIQQAHELAIKGRISEISPFLLLVGSPSTWPSRCEIIDTDFGEFRTLNAVDLPKVHDAVHHAKLSNNVRQRYNQLRVLRNAAMHGVDKKNTLSPKDVLIYIIEASRDLLGVRNWFLGREQHLSDEDPVFARSGDYVMDRLLDEFSWAQRSLGAHDCERLIGFKPNSPSFCCPTCYHSSEVAKRIDTANIDHDGRVKCFLCESLFEVVEEKCNWADCKGVLRISSGEYEGACIECFHYSGDPPPYVPPYRLPVPWLKE